MSRGEWKTKLIALVAQQADQLVSEFGGDGQPARLLKLAEDVEGCIGAEDKAHVLALMVARELRRRAQAALN